LIIIDLINDTTSIRISNDIASGKDIANNHTTCPIKYNNPLAI
jgi:hypothetical protein